MTECMVSFSSRTKDGSDEEEEEGLFISETALVRAPFAWESFL